MQMQLLPQHQLPSQELGCGQATHNMQALQQQHQHCAQVLAQQLAAGLTDLPQHQCQLDRSHNITPTAQSRQSDDAATSSQVQLQKTPAVVLVSDAAGGTAGQPSSATSSETRAAVDWSPDHAGQHSDRNSEEPVQQASAAAMVRPAGGSDSHGRCPAIKEHHHQQQLQQQQQHLARYMQQQPGQQHSAGQLLHIQQQLAAGPILQGQQQQQQQQQQLATHVQSSRTWGWWRASAAPNMWQAMDLLRQPLLQAHSLLGCSASSHQLLGLMRPQEDTAAATAAAEGSTSNVQFSECWKLLQVHAQLAQQAEQQQQQQQQQRLLSQQQAQAAADHAACVEVSQVQQQQQQKARLSLLPPPQQQLLQEQQPQGELGSAQPKRRAAAAAAVTVAAAVDSSKHCSSKQSSAEASTEPPAVQQQQQQHRVQKKPAAAAARPPMPKPPKKPWQPKMAPDDRNWNKVS
jgi:hypothetical protein